MTKKIPYRITLIAMSVCCLASCVPHLNEQQCKTMNWYNRGYQDGSRGDYQHDLSPAIADCAKFKLKVNTKSYAKGWRAGTRTFCTPNNGFNLGTQGSNYNNVCPANLANTFAAAYRRGLRRYCIPTTGYELGRSGKPMPNFCAPDLRVAFSNAYQRGGRIHSQLVRLQNQLNDVNNQINDTQDNIDKNNTIIDQAIASHHKKTRRIAQRENDNLQADLDRLNDTKNSLQQQISEIQGNS